MVTMPKYWKAKQILRRYGAHTEMSQYGNLVAKERDRRFNAGLVISLQQQGYHVLSTIGQNRQLVISKEV